MIDYQIEVWSKRLFLLFRKIPFSFSYTNAYFSVSAKRPNFLNFPEYLFFGIRAANYVILVNTYFRFQLINE